MNVSKALQQPLLQQAGPGIHGEGHFQSRSGSWLLEGLKQLPKEPPGLLLFTQLCLTLCDPMDCSMPDFLSITNSWSLPKLMAIESVMPFNHLILCCSLLLLPSVFLNIRAILNTQHSEQEFYVLMDTW